MPSVRIISTKVKTVKPMHISLAAEPLFYIGSFVVTNSLLVSFFVSIILIIFALLISFSLKKNPGRFQGIAEIIIGGLSDLAESIGGVHSRKYLPLLITFFLYILFSNWIGLLPGFGSIGFEKIDHGYKEFIPLFRGATADLNTTLALALISFFAIQYYGFSSRKLAYLGHFINFSSPIAFFTGILELISEFAKIISFAFRLFGNIFAGEVLLAVIMSLVPLLAAIPFYGLELFVGLIQAFVFTLLTLVFIKTASYHGEEVEVHGN